MDLAEPAGTDVVGITRPRHPQEYFLKRYVLTVMVFQALEKKKSGRVKEI